MNQLGIKSWDAFNYLVWVYERNMRVVDDDEASCTSDESESSEHCGQYEPQQPQDDQHELFSSDDDDVDSGIDEPFEDPLSLQGAENFQQIEV